MSMPAASENAHASPDKATFEIIEGTLIDYAVDRKVDQVVGRYLKTRLLPFLLVAVAIAGYLGFELKEQISSLQKAKEEVEHLQETVRGLSGSLQKQVEKQDRDLFALAQNLGGVKQSSDLAQRQFDTLNTLMRAQYETTRRQEERLSTAAAQLASLGYNTGELQESNEQAQASLRAANQQIQMSMQASQEALHQLQQRLALAQMDYQDLKKLDAMQGRLLAANVVEMVTLKSNDTSPEMELPSPKGGSYEVRFRTPDIESSFDLAYEVDGNPYRVRIDRKGEWRKLLGTDGLYEFIVDNIYSTSKAPDFVSIRVRGTPGLVQARQ